MDVFFDKFQLFDRPYTILCNPNKEELYSLGNSYNTNLRIKYNALSEYSFDLLRTIQNNEGVSVVDPAYQYIESKRLVKIESIGYFQIMKVTQNMNGTIPNKTVECLSLESELINKQINAFSGTLKFYDPISPTGTFIQIVLSETGWSIGNVDSSLWNKYRNFDIPSNSAYNTLMTSAETAYKCIFTFDTNNRTVNAIAVENATSNTDIYISFDNLIKSSNFTVISDEMATVLSVYGGAGLDIRTVNPLGNNKIYNFDYYKTIQWMSQGLINAINAWKVLVASKLSQYSTLLVQLQNQNIQLSALQTALAGLKDHDEQPDPPGWGLNQLILQKKAMIEQTPVPSLTEINAKIAAKRTAISTQNTSITNKKTQIASTTTQITNINNLLSLTNINNFTLFQQSELKPFVIENDYQNESIIITDIMTPAQRQVQAQELYNQALTVIATTSVPRYEFEMETLNVLAIKEFEPFANQLELGCLVTIELREDLFITTALLEIDYSFDNLDNFKLVFSNRLRLDNGSFIYSDLMGQVVNTSSRVSFKSSEWDQYTQQRDSLLNIDSILDATRNEIINSSDQEITLTGAGLIGKKLLSPGNYSPEQVWLTSHVLCFSDDAFETVKIALGKINLFGGGTAYGLAGEAVFGNLLAGNQLVIQDENGTFRVDNNGVSLTDGTISISNNKNTIRLNPSTGISITKNSNRNNIFFVDGNGNLNVKGNITADDGIFNGVVNASGGRFGSTTQGLAINSTGLSTFNGTNYFKGDGSFKWGPFSVTAAGVGEFSGSLDANQLLVNGHIINDMIQDGTIQSAKIGSLDAGVINSGTLNSININWPGVQMFTDTNGYSNIAATKEISLSAEIPNSGHQAGIVCDSGTSASQIIIKADYVYAHGKNIYIGSQQYISTTNIYINGTMDWTNVARVATPSGNGLTSDFYVNTQPGVRKFTFYRGLLVGVT